MRSTIFLLLLFGLVEGYKSIATMSGALSYYDYGKCNSEKQESTADRDKLFVAELNKISMFTFPSMDHHTLVHFGSVNGSEPLNIISMAYNSKKQTLLFIGDKIRSRVYQYSILDKNTTYIDFNGFGFKEIVVDRNSEARYLLTYDNSIVRCLLSRCEKILKAQQNENYRNLAYWHEKQQLFWISESNRGRQLQFSTLNENYVKIIDNTTNLKSFVLDTKSSALFVTKGHDILEFHLGGNGQFVESYESSEKMGNVNMSKPENFKNSVAATSSLVYYRSHLSYVNRYPTETVFEDGEYFCSQGYSTIYFGYSLPKNAEHKRKEPVGLDPYLSLDCSDGCVIVTTHERWTNMRVEEANAQKLKVDLLKSLFITIAIVVLIFCCCFKC